MAFKISNETKVGALTAIAITVLILGYNFLKGKDILSRNKTYYAIYHNVQGLTGSSPVMINGYRVGKVTYTSLLPEDSMKIKVVIEVKTDVEVPDSSIAKIINVDYFGTKAIELILSNKKTPLENGGQLVSMTEPDLISTISTAAAPLQKKVESLVVSLDSVFGGKSGENLRNTIDNIDNITINFKSASANLDKLVAEEGKKLDVILANVESISTNLKNNNDKIQSIIANLKKVSDTVAAANIGQIVRDAQNAMQQVKTITEKINKGEGSIGLLLNDKELYNNLQKSSASLDALLKDLKEHPKRYVHFSIFGKKEKK